MENAKNDQQWNALRTNRSASVRPDLVAGAALAVALAVVTGFNPFMGIASALVFFLWVLVSPRPVLIVYGLALLMPLTGGLARGSAVPFLRLGQTVLVLACILFLLARPGPLGKSRLTVIDLAFVLFFLAEAVFPVLAMSYWGEQLNLNDTHAIFGETPLQILLGPLQYYLLYRVVVATISSERQIKLVLEMSFIAGILVSAIGILEKALPSFRTLVESYYPPVKVTYFVPDVEVRIGSTLAFYSGLGAYLVFIIIVALTCYITGKRLGIHPLLLSATILLASISLVLTGTFAAWIGMVVGAALVFLLMRRVPKLVFFMLAGIALAVLLFPAFLSSRLDQQLGVGAAQGVVPQSLAFRVQLWETLFLPAVGQHLLFGSGPSPAVLALWPAEESQYLLLLLRGGLAYLASYLLLIGTALAIGWRELRRKSGDASHAVAVSLVVIVLTMSVMDVSGEYFTYVGGTQLLWMLLAMTVASGQFKAQGAPAVIEQPGGVRERLSGRAGREPLEAISAGVVVGKSAGGLEKGERTPPLVYAQGNSSVSRHGSPERPRLHE
jgi:hypothetical protein